MTMFERIKAAVRDLPIFALDGEIAQWLIERGFILPPAKPGETVYKIVDGKIEERTVNYIVYEDAVNMIDPPWGEIVGDDFTVSWENEDNIIFFTRDEAIKSLRSSDNETIH